MTFAVHATSRGFSYVVFDGPFLLRDWGTFHARGNKNSACLREIDRLLAEYDPQVMLLEAFGKGTSLRSERIARLYRSIINLTKAAGIETSVYSRADIQSVFKAVGSGTRQDIAEAVAMHIDTINHQIPKPRKAWQSEDRRMALFCAAALVLTHFHFGMSGLFDDLARDQ